MIVDFLPPSLSPSLPACLPASLPPCQGMLAYPDDVDPHNH